MTNSNDDNAFFNIRTEEDPMFIRISTVDWVRLYEYPVEKYFKVRFYWREKDDNGDDEYYSSFSMTKKSAILLARSFFGISEEPTEDEKPPEKKKSAEFEFCCEAGPSLGRYDDGTPIIACNTCGIVLEIDPSEGTRVTHILSKYKAFLRSKVAANIKLLD